MSIGPDAFGQESNDPALFQQLEGEFAGADNRAEALHANDIYRAANELGKVIAPLINSGNFAQLPLVPSYANGGMLAEDGQPLLYYPEDAYAVAKERPELAEIIARKAYEDFSAERQQLALDRTKAANDPTQQEALRLRQEKLEHMSNRVEFWSAVALLHPFNMKEIEGVEEKYFTGGSVWSAYDFDSRVFTLVTIEQEYSRLLDDSMRYPATNVRGTEDDMGQSAIPPKLAADMRNFAEQRAITIRGYERFLTDVCDGKLTTAGLATEIPIPSQDVKLPDELLKLKDVPGRDPVELILNERLHDIPSSGWLISASHLIPGVQGHVVIHQYNAGGLRVSSAQRSARYGDNRVGLVFSSDQSARMSLAYENESGTYDGSPANEQYHEIIPDRPGMRFRYDFLPPRAHEGNSTLHTTVVSNDLEQSVRMQMKGKLHVARVSDSPAEARQIVSELLDVMGASEAGVGQMLISLDERDVFGDLKTATQDEQRLFKALIDARRS